MNAGVVHVITGLATGGAEMSLWRLLAGSAELREHASVISLMDRGIVGPRIEALGVRLSCAGMRRGFPGPIAVARTAAALRHIPHGLVQGWMYHGNLAALTLGKRGVPVLWNIRQSFSGFAVERPLTRVVLRACARLSHHTARIVYNSRASANQHEAIGFDRGRRVIIPNGFDTTAFSPTPVARARLRQELGLGDDVVLIGQVGRLHPMKNHTGLLDAAAQIASTRPSVHWVLAGQGVTANELDFPARWPGLQNRVHFLGEVSEVALLMAALDVLCSASSWGEGFPNVVGEAMSCAVPCVVTDVGDSAWVVGDTGVVVPAGNAAALADAMLRLIDLPPAERRLLGSRARARIEAEFSLSGTTRSYTELYREVVAENCSPKSETRRS